MNDKSCESCNRDKGTSFDCHCDYLQEIDELRAEIEKSDELRHTVALELSEVVELLTGNTTAAERLTALEYVESAIATLKPEHETTVEELQSRIEELERENRNLRQNRAIVIQASGAKYIRLNHDGDPEVSYDDDGEVWTEAMKL